MWWSFLRLTTDTRISAVPTPLDEATRFTSAVRARPGDITADAVSQEHLDHLYAVCEAGEATGSLMPGAALAALAQEHGGEVISFDRGSGRFPDLRWRTPAES
ncbi:putative nucleic acid-binding protein [Saccharopolyspora lacisalsi]|uniref:Putative nucleic acid-binding protein n=1 Tax=Halosaccharopolyspora lacisalsi TaxID=1000566 RepID=A0A839DPN7_9PSEU|nr:putative nucleic acid-binding protein [Halosaccharopolyspora lacisalsi]MBA8822696.1 putative nucleic acid-binding protein [Halosaccharopolyspora lacisalsi]MBA8822699.1 putative nucleic acid-binding protein [Halosaccharopolyspora lacisalsi]